MANTNSEHVVRLSADFSDFVRAAKKAGEKSSDLVSKAIEVGIRERSFAGYVKGLKRFEKQREGIEKRFQALSYAQEVRNAGKVKEKLKEVSEEVAKLNRSLSTENLRADVKARKTAERDLFREKCRLLSQLNEGMADGFTDALKAANKELQSITQEQIRASKAMSRATEQMVRGSDRAAEFMKNFRRDATRGADDFNDRLQSGLDNLQNRLSDVNIGAMIAGGAGSVGKGLGSLAEMAGGLAAAGGAMGTLAAAVSGVALVLGPLIVAFGVFAGVMFGIDREIKDFNKSAVQTFGTRGVMNLGARSMRDNLRILQHATQDLNKTLGLTADEAMGVFDSLDAGNLSMAKLVKGAVSAAQKEEALTEVLRRTGSTAKALGVNVQEFAGNLADYTDTLAFSLENVTDQFSLVAKQAANAGFSTRRFYSLITQATAGQASLNTHLDQTGELLLRISKALGTKQAAELLGGAAGGFKEMGTSERYKTIMTTGSGRTKETITRSAESAARNFALDFASTGGPMLAKAMATAGVSGDTSAFTAAGANSAIEAEPAVKALVDQLARMNREDQARLIAAVEDPTMARRLEQLVSISRGTTGNMADMSDALSSLDPGATIAMKLQSAMSILGRPLHELSGVERMAAESITGMSGSQFEEYQRVAARSEGAFDVMKRFLASGQDTAQEDRAAMAEQYGAIIENGRIVSAAVVDGQVRTGTEINSGMDLLTATVERDGTEARETVDENIALAEEALDETFTISDILQNEISNYLRGIYEDVGLPMLDFVADLAAKWTGGPTREERIGARELRSELNAGASSAGRESATAGRTISKLSMKARTGGELTDAEKQQLQEARRTKAIADSVVSESRAALTRLSSGDMSDLTATEWRTSQGVYASKEAAERASPGGVTQGTSRTIGGSLAAHTIFSRAARQGAEGFDAGNPGVPVPAVSPTPTATVTARASEGVAEMTSEPIVESMETAAETASKEAETTRGTMEAIAEKSDKQLVKTLTRDRKVGDSLARSNLPDAIVEAQVRQQMTSLAFASGLGSEKAGEALEEYFATGRLTPELLSAITTQGGFEEGSPLAGMMSALGIMPGARGLTRHAMDRHRFASETDEEGESGFSPEVGPEVDDFIYRGNGVRGSITPIDTSDVLVGSKERGALDRMSGSGSVNIVINGGDERRVFDVVTRALRAAGVSRRVTSGA